MLPDWYNITYLQHGSLAQRRAFEVLQHYALLGHLRAHHPVLVGTFPLNLIVPGSDLDISCEVSNWAEFRQSLAGFAAFPNYVVRPAATSEPAVVASFEVEGLAVEVFGQALPTTRQNGYRHLVIEARLLTIGGAVLRQRVLALKVRGVKTEPAFAQVLGLPGNPYQALLALEGDSEAELAARLGGKL